MIKPGIERDAVIERSSMFSPIWMMTTAGGRGILYSRVMFLFGVLLLLLEG
jgi:hypothetical protein